MAGAGGQSPEPEHAVRRGFARARRFYQRARRGMAVEMHHDDCSMMNDEGPCDCTPRVQLVKAPKARR